MGGPYISPDPTPTQTTLNADWSTDEALLFSTSLLPPGDLTITNVTNTEIDLSWVGLSPSETGFNIDRSTTSTGGFTQIATVAASITAYSNTGLTTGTTYYYEVQAFDASTTSGFSNVVAATLGSSNLNAPTSLAANIDGINPTSQIDLTWTSNSPVADRLLTSTSSTDGTNFTQIVQAPLASNAPVLPTCTGPRPDGTKYYYEVQSL